jgi:hypothetical protein
MRWLIGTFTTVVVVVALYVGSAVFSLAGLINAVRAADGAAVLARTDVQRVRRSLAIQIVEAYLDLLGQKRAVKPMERLLANTYGATVADALVGKLLTEENLTRMLRGGAVTGVSEKITIPILPALDGIDPAKTLDLLARFWPVKIVEFAVRLSPESYGESYAGIRIHFDGSTWKLSNVELPAKAARALAATIPVK